MNRLKFLTTFILLITATVFAEEDDHDHDHEEGESPAHECQEGGGLYCFNNAAELNCYKNGMSGLTGDLKWFEAYCLCTETSDVNATLLDGKTVTATLGSDGKPNCTSAARVDCFKYKESMYNFYQGECWTEKMCNADPLMSWKAGDVATCAYKEDRCNRMDDAEWHEEQDGTGECECKEKGANLHIDHCHGEESDKKGGAEKWLFGILAVAFVSAFAVIGVLIVLLRHQWWYDLLLSFMVALAMGCLLSDATLHLIPLALGLHSHDDGDDGHDHGHEEEGDEMTATQRRNITIGITAGVYLFLLFEKLIHVVLPNHSHSHGPTEVIANPNAPGDVEMKPNGSKEKEVEESIGKGICNVDSVAWMIIFGDALHNFADGLVMGAAFSESNATGLGTTIAVFCHEVPHELGDFAVLLNAGMKIKYAVLFNFLSACTCFLGLFVGIAAGENEDVQKWIFAFTAGMFIYIACADLIPEMNKMCEAAKQPKLNYGLQQVGVFTGFLVMYLIAVYEGELASIGGGGHHHH